LDETLDSTLEILDWMLETFAGILEVAGRAFEDEEVFLAELVDEEVFLAELVDEVLTDEDDLVELEELFLLEEVIFALVLLDEEDFLDI
jgi:hypothetical protein